MMRSQVLKAQVLLCDFLAHSHALAPSITQSMNVTQWLSLARSAD